MQISESFLALGVTNYREPTHGVRHIIRRIINTNVIRLAFEQVTGLSIIPI